MNFIFKLGWKAYLILVGSVYKISFLYSKCIQKIKDKYVFSRENIVSENILSS